MHMQWGPVHEWEVQELHPNYDLNLYCILKWCQISQAISSHCFSHRCHVDLVFTPGRVEAHASHSNQHGSDVISPYFTAIMTQPICVAAHSSHMSVPLPPLCNILILMYLKRDNPPASSACSRRCSTARRRSSPPSPSLSAAHSKARRFSLLPWLVVFVDLGSECGGPSPAICPCSSPLVWC